MADWVLYKSGKIVREPSPPKGKPHVESHLVVARRPASPTSLAYLRGIQKQIEAGLPYQHMLVTNAKPSRQD